MWDNFLKSVNAVLPIFILVVLGYIFNKANLFSKAFYDDAEKFVFKVALPCQIFLSIISTALWCSRKVSGDYRIPFLPCLWISHTLLWRIGDV